MVKVRPRLYKYEEIAEEVIHLIKSGTFRSGDRIPSVREMSRQKQMSISTVLQAYYLLEAQGFIETRQRSGVYVSTRIPGAMPEPEISSLLLLIVVAARKENQPVWRDPCGRKSYCAHPAA